MGSLFWSRASVRSAPYFGLRGGGVYGIQGLGVWGPGTRDVGFRAWDLWFKFHVIVAGYVARF